MIPPVVNSVPPGAVVADVRWYLDGRSGRQAYEHGHLPGAVFVDLDAWLCGPPSPAQGRHPLPAPEHFAAGMGQLGIGDGDTVIAYDDAGGVVAARLVWMLRVLGHPAALLDGGLQGPLTTVVDPRGSATFTPVPWPADRLASLDDTLAAAVVVDARDAVRYDGAEEPIDPRAGHIPGAVNRPCRSNLADDRRFLPVAELRDLFGRPSADGAISYCGSGVTACHNLLAWEYAGLGVGRLYPGSWSQYSHTDHPVA